MKVRYTKIRDNRPIRSRAILGKLRGLHQPSSCRRGLKNKNSVKTKNKTRTHPKHRTRTRRRPDSGGGSTAAPPWPRPAPPAGSGSPAESASQSSLGSCQLPASPLSDIRFITPQRDDPANHTADEGVESARQVGGGENEDTGQNKNKIDYRK